MFLAGAKPPQSATCSQTLREALAAGFLADTSFDATLVYMAETRCRAEVVFERKESGWLVPERQADISTPCDFTSSGWVDLWRRWENKQRLVLYLCKRHARELGLKW